jgi:tetratricopeptide (TPR) repeat protein
MAASVQEPEPAPEVEASVPWPAEPVSSGAASAFKFAAPADPASAEPVHAQAPAAKAGSAFKFAGEAEAEPATEAAAPEAGRPEAVEPARRPDHEEHFRLGQAFCQMGLPVEAVQELEVALNDPRWFAESCRLLAQCFSQQGQRREAVGYLERAMADPRTSRDEGVLVRYDLGLLYESDGSVEQALQVFSKIPSFQDVPERLARLSRGDAGGRSREAGEPGMVAVGSGGADGAERKKRRISYL